MLGVLKMATVRDLRPSRWAPSMWILHLDGWGRRLCLDREAVDRWGIQPGMELSPEVLSQLMPLSKVSRLKEAAYRLLAWRPRSRSELRERLLKAGGTPEAVEAILDQLQGEGVVNDEAFATYWVQSRLQFRPRSRRELEAELRAKGIRVQDVRDLLEEFPEEQVCSQAALKRAKHLGNLPRLEFHRKLLQYLMRRGFDYDTASRAVEEAWRALRGQEDQQW